MPTTDTTTRVPAYVRERRKVRAMILEQHQDEAGQLDPAALVAAAVARRREVERLEALVRGGTEADPPTQELRDELTQAQWWDHHYQSALRDEIPAWSAALANARTGFSKTMTKAARSLGLAG